MICEINDCGRSVFARQWCQRHYARFRKHGHPEGGTTSNGEPWAHFEATADQWTEECILWPYSTYGAGYGKIFINGRYIGVHIVACIRRHGPRPDGMVVRHLCGNMRCYNHRHLTWGTQAENQADRIAHGTDQFGERNPYARLTAEQVLAIRRRYAAGGVTQQALADEYGVEQTTISCIVRRVIWAWLEEGAAA